MTITHLLNHWTAGHTGTLLLTLLAISGMLFIALVRCMDWMIAALNKLTQKNAQKGVTP